ncbi:MAG: hypothetical protein ACTSRZ_19125 [Promethearchaeota archaeon]
MNEFEELQNIIYYRNEPILYIITGSKQDFELRIRRICTYNKLEIFIQQCLKNFERIYKENPRVFKKFEPNVIVSAIIYKTIQPLGLRCSIKKFINDNCSREQLIKAIKSIYNYFNRKIPDDDFLAIEKINDIAEKLNMDSKIPAIAKTLLRKKIVHVFTGWEYKAVVFLAFAVVACGKKSEYPFSKIAETGNVSCSVITHYIKKLIDSYSNINSDFANISNYSRISLLAKIIKKLGNLSP